MLMVCTGTRLISARKKNNHLFSHKILAVSFEMAFSFQLNDKSSNLVYFSYNRNSHACISKPFSMVKSLAAREKTFL